MRGRGEAREERIKERGGKTVKNEGERKGRRAKGRGKETRGEDKGGKERKKGRCEKKENRGGNERTEGKRKEGRELRRISCPFLRLSWDPQSLQRPI